MSRYIMYPLSFILSQQEVMGTYPIRAVLPNNGVSSHQLGLPLHKQMDQFGYPKCWQRDFHPTCCNHIHDPGRGGRNVPKDQTNLKCQVEELITANVLMLMKEENFTSNNNRPEFNLPPFSCINA